MEALDGGGGLVEAVLTGGGTKVFPAGGVCEKVELLLFLRFDENVKFLSLDVMGRVRELLGGGWKGGKKRRGGSQQRKDEYTRRAGGGTKMWAAGIQPWAD